MNKVLARRARWSAYKLIIVQAVIAIIISFFFFVLCGAKYGLSAVAGGAIAVLPNFVFATLAFSHMGARSAAKIMKNFYWGETIKILLTMALFSLVFINLKVDFLPFFVGFIATLSVHWTAFLYFKQS